MSRFAVPALAAACILAGACASMETPPGGPPDDAAAVLVRTIPDTFAVNVRPGSAVFEFNEVISERQGSGGLSDMFLVSPADGAPDVDWDRNAVEVRPRRGWRPNTTYTVTMLPGLLDLRGNARTEGATVVFSTGPAIATSAVRGIVFDWVAGRVVPGARVEAVSRPDSTIYVGRADSSGTFVIPNIPAGDYTVRGLVDANRNRALDPRELWDSVRVAVRDSARVELLTHAHDTIAPRIDRVTVRDSFTLHVTVDRALDPGMTVDPTIFRLLASDSTPVPIVEARTAAAYEREQSVRERAIADSAARVARPATAGDPGFRNPDARPATVTAVAPSRPSPATELVIVVSRPLRAGASYRLRATLRGIMGTSRESERVFTLPEPPKPAAGPPAGVAAPPGTPVVPPPHFR